MIVVGSMIDSCDRRTLKVFPFLVFPARRFSFKVKWNSFCLAFVGDALFLLPIDEVNLKSFSLIRSFLRSSSDLLDVIPVMVSVASV